MSLNQQRHNKNWTMDGPAARLRKTFHYPADHDSDDSLPEALDEEEQDNLIGTLEQQNSALNKLYSQILLAVPLLSILPYLATLLNPRTSLLSILSISSLASTAYILYAFPPGHTNISPLDNLNKPKAGNSMHTLRQTPSQPDGPIAEYLPLLNVGLCSILGLLGMVFRGRSDVWIGFGWLPTGVYGVVLLAKVIMGSVDPKAELGSLRYGYKGA